MSASDNREQYNGHYELVTYLERKDKSFFGFLLRHRKLFVTSSISSTDLQGVNNLWASRFIYEGEKSEEGFKAKINLERQRRGRDIELFWYEIFQESEMKREILNYEIEKECLLSSLSDIEKKIKAAKAVLAGFTRKFRYEESAPEDFSKNFDEDFDPNTDLGDNFDENFANTDSGQNLDEGNVGENLGDSNEGNVDENLGNSNEGNVDENLGNSNEGDVDENLGNSNEGNVDENLGDSNEENVGENSSGAVSSPHQQKRKRKVAIAPTMTRQLNVRNKERVNYTVGSPRKRRRIKTVSSSAPSLPSPPRIPSTPSSPPHCLNCPLHCSEKGGY